MIKFITYFSLSLLVLFWLSQNNGLMIIDWLGYRVEIELIFLIPSLIIVKIIAIKILFLLSRIKKNSQSLKEIRGVENIVNGLSYVKTGDTLSSGTCINQAKKSFKDEPILKLLTANHLLLKRDNESAKKYLGEIVEVKGNILASTALIQLLNIAYTRENLLELESIINQIISTFPKENWAILKQGEFYCYTKQYEKAVKVLEKVKHCMLEYDLKKRISILYYAIAKKDYLAGEFHSSLKQLEKAGDFMGAIFLKAKVLMSLNKQKKALYVLEKGYRNNPHIDIWNLYEGLGGDPKKLSSEVDLINEDKGWQCISCYKKFKEWGCLCNQCDKLGTIAWI